MKRRQQSGSASRYIIILMIVGLLAGFGYRAYSKQEAAKEIHYQAVPVTVGNLEIRITSTGVVQPENRLEIKPPIAGRIEEVLIEEGENVAKGQILAWMSSAERAALLDAARARGPAEVKRWEEFYKATPIIAPINGTIILRNVEPGQTFTTQEAVFVMSDRLTVKAQVDETDLAQVKLHQDARMTLDAYPSDVIPAHVVQIAYDATTVNNVTTYVVDVLPDTTPEFMRSGMTANVDFLVVEKKNILLLSQEAVIARDGKSFVLVPREGAASPAEVEITTGLSDGKQIEVVSGLKEGESVLIAQSKAGAPLESSPFTPFRQRRSK